MKKPPVSQTIRRVIARIPRGKVATYGQIASAAGIPRGARVVVAALRKSSGLPWHRVVAAGGRIALRGESAFEQRFRLELEGVQFTGRRVRMQQHQADLRRLPNTSSAVAAKRRGN